MANSIAVIGTNLAAACVVAMCRNASKADTLVWFCDSPGSPVWDQNMAIDKYGEIDKALGHKHAPVNDHWLYDDVLAGHDTTVVAGHVTKTFPKSRVTYPEIEQSGLVDPGVLARLSFQGFALCRARAGVTNLKEIVTAIRHTNSDTAVIQDTSHVVKIETIHSELSRKAFRVATPSHRYGFDHVIDCRTLLSQQVDCLRVDTGKTGVAQSPVILEYSRTGTSLMSIQNNDGSMTFLSTLDSTESHEPLGSLLMPGRVQDIVRSQPKSKQRATREKGMSWYPDDVAGVSQRLRFVKQTAGDGKNIRVWVGSFSARNIHKLETIIGDILE